MNEKTAYWDGRYAVWSESLNSDEIMALSQGADPRSIRPDALREYRTVELELGYATSYAPQFSGKKET